MRGRGCGSRPLPLAEPQFPHRNLTVHCGPCSNSSSSLRARVRAARVSGLSNACLKRPGVAHFVNRDMTQGGAVSRAGARTRDAGEVLAASHNPLSRLSLGSERGYRCCGHPGDCATRGADRVEEPLVDRLARRCDRHLAVDDAENSVGRDEPLAVRAWIIGTGIGGSSLARFENGIRDCKISAP
jgi:hypothetical protein